MEILYVRNTSNKPFAFKKEEVEYGVWPLMYIKFIDDFTGYKVNGNTIPNLADSNKATYIVLCDGTGIKKWFDKNFKEINSPIDDSEMLEYHNDLREESLSKTNYWKLNDEIQNEN